MLVLTRKVGEQLVIDGHIIVTIVAIDGNKIRLGISAPPSVRVDRAEVHQRRLEVQDGPETYSIRGSKQLAEPVCS
jgi:carbon storage regulator